MPLSIMVVATSTSISFALKSSITSSTSPAHLAVRHAHARLGRGLLHARHGVFDGAHAVAYVVHLSPAIQLMRMASLTTSGSHSPTCTFTGGVPVGGVVMRLMSRTPLDAHLHGARNGRCRKREHVDLLAQVLELLLVLHAKALLLVDDDQAQVMGFTSAESRRCVPMSTSIVPSANALSARFCCAGVRKRLSTSTVEAKRGESAQRTSRSAAGPEWSWGRAP